MICRLIITLGFLSFFFFSISLFNSKLEMVIKEICSQESYIEIQG